MRSDVLRLCADDKRPGSTPCATVEKIQRPLQSPLPRVPSLGKTLRLWLCPPWAIQHLSRKILGAVRVHCRPNRSCTSSIQSVHQTNRVISRHNRREPVLGERIPCCLQRCCGSHQGNQHDISRHHL